MVELILGGVRSGKSGYAEKRALDLGIEVIYLATATAQDGEMRQRIDRHRKQRPSHWQTVEEPLTLAEAIRDHDQPNRVILVDCLTLWLTNLLLTEGIDLERETEFLLVLLPQLKGNLIMVSNEVGQGIIPLGELNRRFCDRTGELHQQIAVLADRVTLVVAGLPLTLKS